MKLLKQIILVAEGIIDFVVLSLLLLIFTYGCYAIWDSEQIYKEADEKQYATYKPTEEETLPFEELKKINNEVFGWITVYGTHIDYPLVQGNNNEKYVNTDSKGEYSLSGSIFLDYRNKNNFTDFNNILYGHHMDKSVMFGEIADFKDENYFKSHQYGSIYYEGKLYGLSFFAFLEADGYDELYSPVSCGTEETQEYLKRLFSIARNVRNTGNFSVTKQDHIVLLSTCTSDMTNGRHILVGKITDEVMMNPFYDEKTKSSNEIGAESLYQRILQLPLWQKVFLAGFLVLIFLVASYKFRKYYKKRRKEKR